MSERPNEVTRRELLKRGAVVGGSVLWATPIVQTIGMSKAYAADTSPECSVFCLVWAPSIGTTKGGWSVDDSTGCLPCPADATGVLPADIGDFTVVYDGAGGGSYTVTYPNSYDLLPPGDPTPDPMIPGFAAIRRFGTTSCIFVMADGSGPVPGTKEIVFSPWIAGNDRIELVVKQCM